MFLKVQKHISDSQKEKKIMSYCQSREYPMYMNGLTVQHFGAKINIHLRMKCYKHLSSSSFITSLLQSREMSSMWLSKSFNFRYILECRRADVALKALWPCSKCILETKENLIL